MFISETFVDPTHKVKYKGKQNSVKIQNSIWRQSIYVWLWAANFCTLALWSDLRKPWNNASNLSLNNVHIALANYVIEQL